MIRAIDLIPDTRISGIGIIDSVRNILNDAVFSCTHSVTSSELGDLSNRFHWSAAINGDDSRVSAMGRVLKAVLARQFTCAKVSVEYTSTDNNAEVSGIGIESSTTLNDLQTQAEIALVTVQSILRSNDWQVLKHLDSKQISLQAGTAETAFEVLSVLTQYYQVDTPSKDIDKTSDKGTITLTEGALNSLMERESGRFSRFKLGGSEPYSGRGGGL